MTAVLDVMGLSKSFGSFMAVNDVTFDIAQGEFVALLGPSGCGKSTILRMVAGFEPVGAGDILVDGVSQTGIPARLRPINLVFQNYALFPHLSALNNVAFGLQAKKVKAPAARRRAAMALESVHLTSRSDAMPATLSGGEQQRVALARAIVNEPRLLLLDEPLGALDLKLRREMQIEIKRIQHELGLTVLHVTHDQEEALAMSDRIAVMSGGQIIQISTPADLYNRPATRTVAEFLGACNTVDATIIDAQSIDSLGMVLPRPMAGPASAALAGQQVTLCVRAEQIRIGSEIPDSVPKVKATVVEAVFQGSFIKIVCSSPSGQMLTVSCPPGHRAGNLAPDSAIELGWLPSDGWLVP